MAKKEKQGFLFPYDWYGKIIGDEVEDGMTAQQKAWFLDFICEYNVKAVPLALPSDMEDRKFMNSFRRDAIKAFDEASENYERTCIQRALSGKSKDGISEAEKQEIQVMRDFLDNHSVVEYFQEYGGVPKTPIVTKWLQMESNDTNRILSVTDNDSDTDKDLDSDIDIDSDKEHDSAGGFSDADSDSNRGTESDALELNEHLPSVFREDNLFRFTEYLKSIGIKTELFDNYIHSQNLIGQPSSEHLKDYIKRMTFLKNEFNRL